MKKLLICLLICSSSTFAQTTLTAESIQLDSVIIRINQNKIITLTFFQDINYLKSDSLMINKYIEKIIASQKLQGWYCATYGPVAVYAKWLNGNISDNTHQIYEYSINLSFFKDKRQKRNPLPVYMSKYTLEDQKRSRRQKK